MENFPLLICSKKREEKKKKSPSGPPSLAVATLQFMTHRWREGCRSERGGRAASPFPGRPRAPVCRRLCLLCALRCLLCDFERGWGRCLTARPAQASPAGGREGGTQPGGDRGSRRGPCSAGTGSTLPGSFWSQQNRNRITMMLVDAQGQGAFCRLNRHERCSESHNSQVCLPCGPRRPM